MRFQLGVVVIAFIVLASNVPTWAAPEREWGFQASTNFESLLPIGVLRELSAAPLLAGMGGYVRFSWFWGLHGRPWAQVYMAQDRTRMAGGFDLLWNDPSREPDLVYVGFGLMISDFLPQPITNFVIGFEGGRDECNFGFETRFLFLTSFQVNFGCGF